MKSDKKVKQAPTAEESADDTQEGETLLDHVMALRKVLVTSAIAIAVSFVVIFTIAIDWLMGFITAPIVARNVEIIYTTVSEAFTTKFKVALVSGIIVASPIVLWQIWSFIKPALYDNERKSFKAIFAASVVLFLLGVIFCYGAVYTLALDFFMVSGDNLATPMLSIDKYFDFLLSFVLPFGVAFMLPVFLYVTTTIGWTTPKMLQGARKFVILGMAILAAFLTPPDVVSQVMLLLPMLLLYELSILVSKMVIARKKKNGEYIPE